MPIPVIHSGTASYDVQTTGNPAAACPQPAADLVAARAGLLFQTVAL